MNDKGVHLLLILFFSFALVSCDSCSKTTRSFRIDIGYLDASQLCSDGKLAGGVIEIYKPVIFDKQNIVLFQGDIYNLSFDIDHKVSISDSVQPWWQKIRKSILKNQDTYEAVLKGYESTIERISINEICSPVASLYTKNLNRILSKSYSSVFVLSKTNENKFNYPVFSDAKILKDSIANMYRMSGSNSVFVIIDNGSAPPPPPPGSDAYADGLREKLIAIADTKKTDEQRARLAEQVWDEYFYERASVDIRDCKNRAITSKRWPPGTGKQYLTEHLALLPSIVDISINECSRDKESNKVSELVVCETENGSIVY